MMRRISFLLFVLGIALSAAFPAGFIKAEEESILPSDMLHFVVTVRWGNVRGDVIDKTETNFDGSINVGSEAKVSLIRTLLFEKHNDIADKITSERDPVSWNSIIYGHWDGLRALVSSPANENVTITTAQGTVTKTAQQLLQLKEPFIFDVGNGKEIVIETHRAPKKAFIAKIIWGATDRNDYLASNRDCDRIMAQTPGADNLSSPLPIKCRALTKENFSGSLAIENGAQMKLLRELRWEKHDRIISREPSEISWNSYIFGGVDGVLVKFDLNRNISKDSQVTLTFPEQDWSRSISLLKLYHEKHIKKEIKPGYGVSVSVWQHPDRRLIRARNDYKIYMMEDGLRRHIPNPRVFEDRGLDWNEVVVVEPDEVEVEPEGEALSYTEGTLIRGDGPEVYAISNGEKRHIRNPLVFQKLKYNWKNIIKVDNAELDIYPTGAPLDESSDYPDSTLIRAEGEPTVYVVEGDKLKPVTSPEAFASHNYRWNRVKVVDRSLKGQYKIAEPLKLGDGSLVRDPSGKIYNINHGKKRWIRTGDDFVKAGFKWDKVVDVTREEISDLEEDEDVVAEDLELD